MENPIKMDDLGVPLFLETPKYKFQGGGWTNPLEKHESTWIMKPQGSGWKYDIFELPPPTPYL